MKLQMAQREVLPNSVMAILRQAILKGDLKPNERLVQSELAEQLGVSRMPIREALKTLELEGLVTNEPHRGAVVNPLTVEDLDEIYEIRTMLEPMALRKSIPNLSQEDLESLRALHEKMIGTTAVEAYVELNREFHDISLNGCRSKRLHGLMSRVSHGIAKDTPYMIPDQIEKSNKEHAEILGAIQNGHIEQACEEFAFHISRTHADLMPLLKLNSNEG